MSEKNIEQNIKKKVLERIREGKVHMRSRAYFAFRLIATIIATLAALIVSAFLISFVFFSIHESGEQFLLGFGDRGILTFFLLFPWKTFLLDIAILLLLVWLLQGFKFAYKASLLTIFLIIFAESIILGIVFNLSPVHKDLLNEADRGELPFVGEIYEGIHDSHADRGVFRGTIISEQGDEIVIGHDDKDHDVDDGERTVILPPEHPLLETGDNVYVFGTPSNNVITARGIEKLSQ